MRVVVVKAFIILDALFAMSLLLAVVLLCGYFELLARGFGGKSSARRSLIARYYSERMNKPTQAKCLPAGLRFEQRDKRGAVVCVRQRRGAFTAVNDVRAAPDNLYVRFDEEVA